MRLKTYLQRKKISQRAFAEKIGTARQGDVSRWASGTLCPRVKTILRIQRITRGAVKPNDW